MEMSLLADVLSVKLQVFRPVEYGSSEFMTLYPEMDSNDLRVVPISSGHTNEFAALF